MRARVHYNLHTLVWSVVALEGSSKGRVIHRAKRVELGGDIKFHVGEKSRQKVLQNKVRSVHAYISGELISVDEDRACAPSVFEAPRGERLSYNPYKAGHFYNKITGTEATPDPEKILFNADGSGYNSVISQQRSVELTDNETGGSPFATPDPVTSMRRG